MMPTTEKRPSLTPLTFGIFLLAKFHRDGEVVVKLDVTDYQSTASYWSNSLIGYVINDNPYEKEIENYVNLVWKFVAKPQILYHADGYYIFRFQSNDDKDLGEEKFQESSKRKKRNKWKKTGAQAWKLKPPLEVMQDHVHCPAEMVEGTTPNSTIISTQEHNEAVAHNTGATIGTNLSNRYVVLKSNWPTSDSPGDSGLQGVSGLQGATRRVYRRIDWVLGNQIWMQKYRHVEAEFLTLGMSDHSPALVHCIQRSTLAIVSLRRKTIVSAISPPCPSFPCPVPFPIGNLSFWREEQFG
ncbi:hypothetical protein HAX54_006646 [Datura stramonium]|uniref:DUF4283 domain-containing protein n=1 Tax=Datura stramonium TaxID=4076 RepID=A0ABS8WYV4_DATST|nr:hypothetical protein [Datura stramonium]